MLYFLANILQHKYSFLHVFNYVSFRAVMACIISFFISLQCGKPLILWLNRINIGQIIRLDGPKAHLLKSGTPTMGGLLILFSIIITVLIIVDLSNEYIHLLLFVLLSSGCLGFIDDYQKIRSNNSKGVSARKKLLAQLAIALIVATMMLYVLKLPSATHVIVPFFKAAEYPFGQVGFILLTCFVIIGSSNAVNLTDGLDGLVSIPIVMCTVGLAVFAYIAGHKYFSHYLYLPYIPLAHEIVVFCAAIIGATLGFLWFNAHPAQIFMGDVGSLSLGAVIGCIAIIVRQELIFSVMGGLFVIEAGSVILQIGSYKLRKKRIFRMSPIHHHFELKGWSETQVVVRFWIISIALLLIVLATIKLR
jgi:phospho-N-acetylmuramoyl-pentapeptide-transferase